MRSRGNAVIVAVGAITAVLVGGVAARASVDGCPASDAQLAAPESAAEVDGWRLSDGAAPEPIPGYTFDHVQTGSAGLCAYRRDMVATKGEERRGAWLVVRCGPVGPDGCPIRWAQTIELKEARRAAPPPPPPPPPEPPVPPEPEFVDPPPPPAPPIARPSTTFPRAVFLALVGKPVSFTVGGRQLSGTLMAVEEDQLFVALPSGEVVPVSRLDVTKVHAGAAAPVVQEPVIVEVPPPPPAPEAVEAPRAPVAPPEAEPGERLLDQTLSPMERQAAESELSSAQLQLSNAESGGCWDWTMALVLPPLSLCGAYLGWGAFAGHDDGIACTLGGLFLTTACTFFVCGSVQLCRKRLDIWSAASKIKRLKHKLASQELPLEPRLAAAEPAPLMAY